uniref:Uncharacterized protein n=1 Tax=Onchocerca volvulus TaxID=6282 RepID=A0A8R1XUF4_ONCVO
MTISRNPEAEPLRTGNYGEVCEQFNQFRKNSPLNWLRNIGNDLLPLSKTNNNNSSQQSKLEAEICGHGTVLIFANDENE